MRAVRFPRYVKLQRERTVLMRRLKVPPAINHFTHVLPKPAGACVVALLRSWHVCDLDCLCAIRMRVDGCSLELVQVLAEVPP